MSPRASDDVTQPTGRTRRLGDIDPSTAGLLETVRGLGTSGAVALLLYQLITGRMDALAADVGAMRRDVAADIAGLRVQVATVQARVDAAHPQGRASP